MTLSVDDILAAKPSLKRRAATAAAAANKEREQANYEQEQDLLVLTCEWLTEVAKCSPAELEDIEFAREAYNSNGEKRQLSFSVDGLTFRTYFNNMAVRDEIVVQLRKTGGTWVVVKTLADVGEALT